MTEDLIKVRCGQCDGQMRVRNTGEAVVCPHCGAHLEVLESTGDGDTLSVQSGSGVLDRLTGRSGPNLASRSGTTTAPAVVTTESKAANQSNGVSKTLFMLVASYASAMTLVAGYLLFFRGGDAHQLESLPDVRTLKKGEFQFAGFESKLPEGHVLKLGESRRFGDVKVTPVKVTREPIEFEHYSEHFTREPTADVLKLWLEFENVSESATFPPYDVALMSDRAPDQREPSLAKANSFLARANLKPTLRSVMLNFEHPLDDEFVLKGMTSRPLEPGASQTTFLACSEEGTEKAMNNPGDYVWRVQLRKGISESGKGVTTLVDVKFATSDIN